MTPGHQECLAEAVEQGGMLGARICYLIVSRSKRLCEPKEARHGMGSHNSLLVSRVHTRQGNVREIKKISRSGNCQGILCCVSEKWIFAKMSGKCQGIL